MHTDEQRLKGIESVHRGFLYQHLYTVGCILLARTRPAVLEVVAERDEDAEIVCVGEHRYVQIKTRSARLQLSDVSDAVDRFQKVRDQHADGEREGSPAFFLVCNTESGESLRADSRFIDLGVRMISPLETLDESFGMPPGWASIEEGLEWCRTQADSIPQTRLDGATLVWKLATEVALASAGARKEGHVFRTHELDDLLELFFRRIQALPAPPEAFRSLDSEPPLESASRIRLIVGVSGAGKTAWIAHRALHVAGRLVYFDVADNDDGTVAPSLVREIAGALAEFGQEGEVRHALYAGASGLTALKAIDGVLTRAGMELTIVVDNAHRITPPRVQEVVTSIDSAHWILLMQPCPAMADLRVRLSLTEESLGGMRNEGIAAEFRQCGAAITITNAERVKRLTAGLPLFVRDAAMLCRRRFDGDSHALCLALEGNETMEVSAQEIVLQGSIANLSMQAARSASALALTEPSLTEEETLRLLCQAIGLAEAAGRACLRELTSWGIVQILPGRSVTTHDAFRAVLRASTALTPPEVSSVWRFLADAFKASIAQGRPERFLAYCRVAPKVGETVAVVELVSSMPEHLHEHGTSEALHAIIAAAAGDLSLPEADRFWATDTLMFWHVQRGASPDIIRADMDRLEALLGSVAHLPRARHTVAIKRILLAGTSRDAAEVRRAYADAARDVRDDQHGWLILRYMYALSLWKAGQLDSADLVTRTVVRGCLVFIGLRPAQLSMTIPAIASALGNRASDVDDIKHVADAIDLRARILEDGGRATAFLKLWAFKLYALANAPLSAVKIGKDVVDDLLSIGAVKDALQFMETTLIPGTVEQGLIEELVPLRAQYAVVLAYAGRTVDARKEIADLSTFESTSESLARELGNQRELIERIASGRQRLKVRERNLDESGLLLDDRSLGVGRNQPCPCGADLKFKQCCGR